MNINKKLYLFIIVFAAFLQSSVVIAAQENWAHPDAKIEKTDTSEKSVFLYFSAPKRVSNQLRFERSERLDTAKVTELLLRFDRSEDMEAIWKYYASRLSSAGTLEFSCEHRACGTSTNWANKIYEISKLTGRDDNQYYVVGKLKDSETWVSVYLVTNGRKQNYAYVQQIEKDSDESDETLVNTNSALLLDKVTQDGFKKKLSAPSTQSYLTEEDAVLVQIFFPLGVNFGDSITSAEKVKAEVENRLSKDLGLSPARIKVLLAGPTDQSQSEVLLSLWKLSN